MGKFAPFFGTGEAGGIGLYIFGGGLSLFVVSIIFYASPMLRHIEDSLIDYIPEEEELISAPDLQAVPVGD